MREELVKVINTLGLKSEQALYCHNAYAKSGNQTSSEMFNWGLYVAYEKAIKQLEGVLNHHEADNTGNAAESE